MHYFKRNIGDYHKKAGRLSMLEHGAYTLLMDACYDREKFPTMDQALDWCWARSDGEVAAVKFVLEKFFTLEGEQYMQHRIADEIERYHQNAKTNKQIALDREAAKRAERERIEHEACTDHARMSTDEHLTTNQEPLTTNQEPEDQQPCDQQAESPDLLGDPKPAKAPQVVIPYDDILKAYAEELPGLPQPRSLDPDRRQAVRVIWTKNEEFGSVDFFRRYFAYIAKSDFLMGGTGWTSCNFDWIFKPKNFRKITESTYHKESSDA